MWKNYLKTSFRSLWRHRFYTSVNILGLSVGVACCLLIMLFVKHELSYDQFYANSQRIYRVALDGRGLFTPALLGKQFKEDYPQVEAYTRVSGLYPNTFVVDDKVISEPGGSSADSTIFQVFSMELLEGDANTALSQPNSVVLTKSLAEKYFPAGNTVGKVVKIGGVTSVITAVVADPPTSTHFPFRYLMAMPADEWVTKGNWTANNFYTYVKLQEGYAKEELEAQMPDFVRKYIGPELISFTGHATFDEYLEAGNEHFFLFLPLTDIHLRYPRFSMGNGGSINNVYVFSIVAIFILVIACVNFINLTTAKSAGRSKEVGMRQVLGAVRSELVKQFLLESFIVSLFSVILAVVLAMLAMPFFNELAGKSFGAPDLFTKQALAALGGLFLVVALLAGGYPAVFLSGLKPVVALKGELKGKKSSAFLRKTLVGFQFGVSIFLCIATFTVFSQLNYLSNQTLGMETSQVLVVRRGHVVGEKAEFFKNQVEANANIAFAAVSDSYPSERHSNRRYLSVGESTSDYNFTTVFTDENYLKTLGIELLEGRFFESNRTTDTANIMVNEATARELGWQSPIGQKLSRRGEGEFTVIGVVKDFNYNSLKSKVGGLVIHRYSRNVPFSAAYLVRISGNYNDALSHIKEVWESTVPEEPFDYTFLDDSFSRLYEAEERFGQVFTTFSVLAILIACLGLFALAAFTLQKRFKEIAIRKVLGASTLSITTLVLMDFTKLVLLGAVVAVPLAFYGAEGWLKNFEYRVHLSMFLFLLPVVAVIVIAWLTVAFQSVKTAKANPVDALKQE